MRIHAFILGLLPAAVLGANAVDVAYQPATGSTRRDTAAFNASMEALNRINECADAWRDEYSLKADYVLAE